MKENEKLYTLLNNAPTAANGAQNEAAALAAAEAAAQNVDYSNTADGRLDRAINDYLTKSGLNYDISRDNSYKEFARAYSQNALSGRNSAQEGANQLSGGYTPTYSNAVGSAVMSDIAANAANYSPTFRALGKQEAAARAAQAANSAQALGAIADTGYQRNRDLQGDKMNYLGYLADRYQSERQADAQLAGYQNDVWRSMLSSALQNATEARSLDNRLYQFNSQSADSRAKLAADAVQFNQKLAYKAAEDAYNDRVAAAKAQAKADEKAQKAADKAAAANEKAAAKEQAALEKEKTKYAQLARDIKYVTEENNDLTLVQRLKYDLNGDHVIDKNDIAVAERAARTGSLDREYTVSSENYGSTKATSLINDIKKAALHYGTGLGGVDAETIEKMVNDRDLSTEDAILVYQYFGL